MTSLESNERTSVFHSSGTTEQKPAAIFTGRIAAVYEASLWNWFEMESRIPNSELRIIGFDATTGTSA